MSKCNTCNSTEKIELLTSTKPCPNCSNKSVNEEKNELFIFKFEPQIENTELTLDLDFEEWNPKSKQNEYTNIECTLQNKVKLIIDLEKAELFKKYENGTRETQYKMKAYGYPHLLKNTASLITNTLLRMSKFQLPTKDRIVLAESPDWYERE